MKTNEFSQSRLVEEGDYIKVGASMPGIHSMRTRPGLTLDATICSGESARLEALSPCEVSCVGHEGIPAVDTWGGRWRNLQERGREVCARTGDPRCRPSAKYQLAPPPSMSCCR